MIQLYAFENGVKYELDLYGEEPIKINISAEDITTVPSTDSTFSRQFRIPGTARNSRFFKYWYTAGIADFDIRKKVSAEIHVDGILYRSGQLRMIGTYNNEQADSIDFEVHFLGETKDFATQVGEGFMNELSLGQYNFQFDTVQDLQDSWRDFTDPDVLGYDTTLGYGGVVRWCVAQRGNTYDSDGIIQENWEVALNETGPTHNKSFGKNAHPMDIAGFTPLVQVKAIIDAIFDRTSYSYSSDSVFNDQWFEYLYTDGLPDASPITSTINTGFEAQVEEYDFDPSFEEKVEYTNEIFDGSNAYDPTTFVYTVPTTDTYQIDATLGGTFSHEAGSPSAVLTLRMYVNGVEVDDDTDSNASGGQETFSLSVTTGLVGLTAGDTVHVTVESDGGFERGIVESGTFDTDTAPQQVSVPSLLKDDVKIIDFFKSILNKFRLVMVPNKNNPLEFIVKPWTQYIGTGDEFDWSHKLDATRDQILKPIFYEQSATILFADQEDEDKKNSEWQNTTNQIYGRYLFDSQNELLQDTRAVQSVFAPTPVDTVEGATAGSSFIIPYFTVQLEELSDHDHAQHVPMKPKPRLLFWNGLASIPATDEWHYTDDITTVHNTTDYPRATPVQNILTTPDTRNLNWKREDEYISADSSTGMYEYYWDEYIQNIYANEARLLVAYFVLDSEDLRNLTFDDTIFIRDTWWRLNKVVDAPLNETASVKVELIKIDKETIPPTQANEDSSVVWYDDPTPPPVSTYWAVQTCVNPGDIQIVSTSGPAPQVGDAVKTSIDGGAECWSIIDTATAPATGTILATYSDCFSCNE